MPCAWAPGVTVQCSLLEPRVPACRAQVGGATAQLLSPGVYAFGFLFMLPQLFVNYKVRRDAVPAVAVGGVGGTVPSVLSLLQMKSVAHLPWKAFTYKVSTVWPRAWGPTCLSHVH